MAVKAPPNLSPQIRALLDLYLMTDKRTAASNAVVDLIVKQARERNN
jgi:hypothetical protein